MSQSWQFVQRQRAVLTWLARGVQKVLPGSLVSPGPFSPLWSSVLIWENATALHLPKNFVSKKTHGHLEMTE